MKVEDVTYPADAPTVSEDVKHAKPFDVYTDLAKQVQCELKRDDRQDYGDQSSNGAVDFTVANIPFWQAVAQLGATTHQWPMPARSGINGQNGPAIPGQLKLGFDSQQFAKLPSAHAAGASVFLQSVSRQGQWSADNANGTTTTLSFSFFTPVHPSLRPAAQDSITFNVDAATADDGQPLDVKPDQGNNFDDNSWFPNASLAVEPPPKPGGAIKLLKGTAKFQIVTKAQRLTVSNLSAAVPSTVPFAGMNIELKKLSQQNGNWQLEFVVHDVPGKWLHGKPGHVDPFYMLCRSIRVLDADGKAFDNGGGGGGNEGHNGYRMSIYLQSFNGGGEDRTPSTLTWEVPTDTQAIEVPFEFHDIKTAEASAALPSTPDAPATTQPAVEPTRITLHVKNQSFTDVLADLSRQSGLTLQAWQGGNDDANITLDADKQPLLEVLRDAWTQASCQPQPNGPGQLSLQHVEHVRDAAAWHSACNGTILYSLQSISTQRSKNFAQDTNWPGNFSASLQVLFDPAVPIEDASWQVKVDAATDDAGSTTRSQDGQQYEQMQPFRNMGGGNVMQVQLQLPMPSAAATKFNRLQGTYRLRVEIGAPLLTVADLSDAIGQPAVQAGGFNATIDDVDDADNASTVKFTLNRGTADAAAWKAVTESVSAANGNPTVMLRDVDGLRLQTQVADRKVDGDALHVTLKGQHNDPRGQQTGPAAMLIWRLPGKPQLVDVPIDLADVPIPQ